MRVFGIQASPRAPALSVSTRLLQVGLERFRNAGWEATAFDLPAAAIPPCRACGACTQTGVCPHTDGAEAFYRALLAAEAVVLASPVYFYSVPAQLKAVIDRAQVYWHRRFVQEDVSFLPAEPVPLLFISVAGGPPAARLFQGADLVVTAWANTLGLDVHSKVHLPQSDGLADAAWATACEEVQTAVAGICGAG